MKIGSQTLMQSFILQIDLINHCDKMRKTMPVLTNAGVPEAQKVAKPGFKGTWFDRLPSTEVFEGVVLEIRIGIRYWSLAVPTLAIPSDRKTTQRCGGCYAVSVPFVALCITLPTFAYNPAAA